MKKQALENTDYPSSTWLKHYRLKAGMTLAQLSEKSGVNVRQIQRVESGQSKAGNLTAKNFLALADALAIEPHELIKPYRVFCDACGYEFESEAPYKSDNGVSNDITCPSCGSYEIYPASQEGYSDALKDFSASEFLINYEN